MSLRKSKYLVNSNEVEVVNTLRQWQQSGDLDESKLEKWMAQGLLFKLGKSTNEDIVQVERKKHREHSHKTTLLRPSAARVYVNAGSEE